MEYDEDHALVVNLDVGMVVGVFGARHERAHEQHGLGKILERELLPDRVAVGRPAVEALQAFGDLFRCQQRHDVGAMLHPPKGAMLRNRRRVQIAKRRVGGPLEDQVVDELARSAA